jgi:hypothetical protein
VHGGKGSVARYQCRRKTRYATRDIAEREMKVVRARWRYQRMSVYQCTVCDGWHLTTHPKGNQ